MTDIDKYASLMQEIKLRTEVIVLFLAGRHDTKYAATTIESVGLQFRKIFELIAFASLAANRDQYSAAYSDFAKHWELAKLVRNLRKVNPDFYPKPVVEAPTNQPGAVHDLKDRDQDYFTQDELVEAHGRCGSLAHAANPFAPLIDYAFFQRSFPVWLTKVANLLSNHKVHLVGDTKGYWLIHMHENAKGNNEVSQYRFERTG